MNERGAARPGSTASSGGDAKAVRRPRFLFLLALLAVVAVLAAVFWSPMVA